MRALIIIYLFTVIMFSCKKTNIVKDSYDILSSPYLTEITDSFPDWAFRNDTVGIQYIRESYREDLPCFNPNDNREFCYSYWDSTSINKYIKTFNLETGNDKIIYNSGLRESMVLSWGNSDRIAFWLTDFISTKTMNPDGSDIKEIKSDRIIGYPVWSSDGKYLFVTQSKHLPSITYPEVNFLRLDGKSLEIIDTVYIGPAVSSGSTIDNSIYFHIMINSVDQIVKMSLDQFRPKKVIPYQRITSNFATSNLFTPSPDGNFLYFCSNGGNRWERGIYRYDIHSDKLSKYKNGNTTMEYNSPSFSNDGRFMLCKKSYYNRYFIPALIGVANEHVRSYIHLIDLHTDKEYRVDFKK